MSVSKISSILKKKRAQVPVNLKCDAELYENLKAKLKKDNSTVHDFFESLARAYISEK